MATRAAATAVPPKRQRHRSHTSPRPDRFNRTGRTSRRSLTPRLLNGGPGPAVTGDMTTSPSQKFPRHTFPPAVPTLGAEEEFLLLQPDGRPACIAPQILRSLGDNPLLQPELMR